MLEKNSRGKKEAYLYRIQLTVVDRLNCFENETRRILDVLQNKELASTPTSGDFDIISTPPKDTKQKIQTTRYCFIDCDTNCGCSNF